MTTCLVTGAAGFIASHLCEALLEQGHQVIGVDCFTAYYDPAQKHANLRQIQAHPRAKRFRFVEGDLATLDLEANLKTVEMIFHLAGEPGVRKSWGREFSNYLNRNIAITQRLLESCKGKKIQKFVFASSSSVYGNRGTETLRESDRCRPFSPYGVTKLAAENLCMLYHDNYGLPTVAVRYFTVFGPRQRPDMAFHRFIRNALEKKPLIIYGDGKQSRDFTFVSDAVAATLAAGFKGQDGNIYNVGGGCPATVAEVLEIIAQLVSPERLNFQKEKGASGDVQHTRSDIQLAREVLKYNPQVSLQDGLQQEFDWLQKYLRGA